MHTHNHVLFCRGADVLLKTKKSFTTIVYKFCANKKLDISHFKEWTLAHTDQIKPMVEPLQTIKDANESEDANFNGGAFSSGSKSLKRQSIYYGFKNCL